MDDLPPAIFKEDLGKGGWSNADIARELAFMGLLGTDWFQTKGIVKDPGHWHENNPLLGEHPSMGKLNTAVSLSALGHLLLSNYLSPENRKLFQNISLGVEGANVGRNFKVGVKMDF